MYAIFELGGKQHRVQEGDVLKVERLTGEVGSSIHIDDILLLGGEETLVGTPHITGAKVGAEILAHGTYPKLIIHKHKRRKNYSRTRGHRQQFSEIIIRTIEKS